MNYKTKKGKTKQTKFHATNNIVQIFIYPKLIICKKKIDKFVTRGGNFSIYYSVKYKKHTKIRNQYIAELNNLNIKRPSDIYDYTQ